MSHPRTVLALVLASCSLSVVACASPTSNGGDDAEAQDGELTKKVNPTGGNGAFDLLPLDSALATPADVGRFRFDNVDLAIGERREKVPGTYALQALYQDDGSVRTPGQRRSFDIVAGAVAKHKVSALTVRFAEPVTVGRNQVTFRTEGGDTDGVLRGRGSWERSAAGATMLVLDGTFTVTSAAEGVSVDVVVAEGARKEIVLPVARLSVQVDAYDPAYPTPTWGSGCNQPTVSVGANGFQDSVAVRNADGSPTGTFVVPQGANAPVVLSAYGVEVTQATVKGKTHTFALNRLLVDDVAVAQAKGGSQMVKGTVDVRRKQPNGTFTSMSCSFPTHFGIDVPDGVYQVTSQAQSPSGIIKHVEEVSFP
jgi:hypothetical protein